MGNGNRRIGGQARRQRRQVRPGHTEFDKWFGATEPVRVELAVRPDEDMLHNLTYLVSYIHDAEVSYSGIRTRRYRGRSRLCLDIARDCWESWDGGGLDTVRSLLVIEPLERVEWVVEHQHLARVAKDSPQPIVDVHISLAHPEAKNGSDRISLLGPLGFWALAVVVPSRQWSIRLKDTGETVYSYSNPPATQGQTVPPAKPSRSRVQKLATEDVTPNIPN